jgi:hypothetical protein
MASTDISSRFSLPRSTRILGLDWVGERIPYPDAAVKGDTFPMTWADDDEIYTSAGDPHWGDTPDGLDVEKISGGPADYTITKVNPMNGYRGWAGSGPKPTGMICVDGILYLAFQNLRGMQPAPFSLRSQHGSDAHIVYADCNVSGCYGVGQWMPPLPNIGEPMFPGFRFGGPAFINFGKDNANARDGFVYAVSSDQWDNGSNLTLGRVPADRIIRREAWEWVCAIAPDGTPAWSADLERAIPVLSLHRWLGAPEMVYLAGIKRYLLLTWHLHRDFSGDHGTDLVVLESPEPWGPFSLVHAEGHWEGSELNPYCPRVPLKWLDSDGAGGWLQFSGSWSKRGQAGGHYRSHIRRFRLRLA